MLTTSNYILDEDIFEPSKYRNHKFKKICHRVQGHNLEIYTNKILYFNKKGQIIRIERKDHSWNAYPPGNLPPLTKIDVFDSIKYDPKDRIISITTRSLDKPNLEIGKTIYLYDQDQLIRVENIKGNSYTRKNFEYIGSNLVKIEVFGEISNASIFHDIITYKWNDKNQIFKKDRISVQKPDTKFELLSTYSTSYQYKKNGQLQDATTSFKIEKSFTQSTSKIKYTNSISDLIAQIETFQNGVFLNSIYYSIDESKNTISARYKTQNNIESLVEYIASE